MTTNTIQTYIQYITKGQSLSFEDAGHAFQIMMRGGATPAQIAGFLTALKMKGETIQEIAGAANAMRAVAKTIQAPTGTLDTCGTGGDGKHTLNISTAVALLTAACGVPVAKHGNRSVSSRCGSADVLEMLGFNLELTPKQAEQCLEKYGFCFLFAPMHHPAMRHVAPIRKELGIRTIFNILGPLANPAATDYQLLGVYDPSLMEIMAHVLQMLGTKRAWVVHGADGMDELSITGSSYVTEIIDDTIHNFEISPTDAGLDLGTLEAIEGKDAAFNASALRDLVQGAKGTYRNAVLYNTAASLIIAGKTDTLLGGVEIAANAIENGDAWRLLSNVASFTQEVAQHG